jgi:hypothetical protein
MVNLLLLTNRISPALIYLVNDPVFKYLILLTKLNAQNRFKTFLLVPGTTRDFKSKPWPSSQCGGLKV